MVVGRCNVYHLSFSEDALNLRNLTLKVSIEQIAVLAAEKSWDSIVSYPTVMSSK